MKFMKKPKWNKTNICRHFVRLFSFRFAICFYGSLKNDRRQVQVSIGVSKCRCMRAFVVCLHSHNRMQKQSWHPKRMHTSINRIHSALVCVFMVNVDDTKETRRMYIYTPKHWEVMKKCSCSGSVAATCYIHCYFINQSEFLSLCNKYHLFAISRVYEKIFCK